MSVVKWDPLREMEDLFDRYTRAVGWPRTGGQEIVATFKDGMLNLDIPKTAAAKPRQIEVKVK